MVDLGYTVKEEIDKFPDLSYTAMNQIPAKDIRNGMWCIHSKSGFTGQVIKCSHVKSGKRGHTKCVYELRYPHNNKIAKESCSGKTIIKQAIINKIEYQLSYIEKGLTDYKKLNQIKQIKNKLIFGFIRKENKQIPKEIMHLCIEYYFIPPENTYTLVCMTEDYQELYFPVPNSNANQKLFNKIQKLVYEGDENDGINQLADNDCFVVILECPKVNKKNVVMIQIIYDLRLDPITACN